VDGKAGGMVKGDVGEEVRSMKGVLMSVVNEGLLVFMITTISDRG